MRRMDYSSFSRRKQKAASERGKRMAARRWELDRQQRAALAAMSPEKFTGRIVRRIVVITNETKVREAIIYDFDSARSARRKERAALAA